MHVFGVLYTVRKGLLIKHVNNLLLQFYRWDMSLSADCCTEAASRPPKEQLGSTALASRARSCCHRHLLHLMLRITDILMPNLIWKVEELDLDERQRNCTIQPTQMCFHLL